MHQKVEVSSKKLRYTIQTEGGPEQVEGYPVTFPGYEQFQFAVHRGARKSILWVVSEVSTGRAISGHSKTRNDAIESAERLLATRTPKALEEGIKYVLEMRSNQASIARIDAEIARLQRRRAELTKSLIEMDYQLRAEVEKG